MYNLTAVKMIYIIVIRGLSNRWKGKVCYKIFFVLKVDHRFNSCQENSDFSFLSHLCH